MLVSLAIVATIVTMVYGSYAATSRSLDVYSSRTACSERTHLVLRLLARQIRCAYAPATSKPVFEGGQRNLRGDVLSFATTGGLGQGFDGPTGISLIGYRYDESGKTLSICCENWTGRSGNLQHADAWQPILTAVTGVELGFYDGRDWQPRWDAKASGQLPKAVRVAISVTDAQGREHHYGTTVATVCRRISQVQKAKKAGGRT